jgi:hypothetical protein
MIAQFYLDPPEIVRVFNKREVAWRQAIMDCIVHENEAGLEHADAALRRCRLRRTTKWKFYPASRFYEASCSPLRDAARGKEGK